MRVLTFNLHSQYLYLLSFTGWDIDNLVIPPTDPPGWHTQPYGFPTHSPAVHPVPGFDYHAYFPKDWSKPTMVPTVENVHNIARLDDYYDLVIYLERDSLNFFQGPAAKKIMVNFNADGFSPVGYVDRVVAHVPGIDNSFFVPMGIPDNYLPRDPQIKALLVSYAAGRWRPHLINQEIYKAVADEAPIHFHDMVEEEWNYETLKKVLSQFWVYFSPVMMMGGPPLALIEALMAGLPCIIHDPYGHFGGMTEEECMRVESPEEATLAVKSLWKFDRMRHEMGEAGRHKAQRLFSIDRFVQGWHEAAA